MAPKILTGLRPQAYEHPQDTAALDALEKTAGFGTFVSRLNAIGIDKVLRTQLTGCYLRVTADSFPDLYEILATACRVLDHRVMPDMYIIEGDSINAFTSCVEQPLIAISTGAVCHLSDQELLYVIAHEVGHIKSGHILYYQIANKILPVAGELVGAIPVVGDLIRALAMSGGGLALLHWMRTSELTADRAGLLACQDANVAFSTMAKLAGLPAKYYSTYNTLDFIQQARDFKAMDADWGSKIVKILAGSTNTHPWTVLRAQELLTWFDSGQYGAVVANPSAFVANPGPPPLPPNFGKRLCPNGHVLHGTERFCSQCGAPVAPMA
jgi:Zn-dependent protease with chaperone function